MSLAGDLYISASCVSDQQFIYRDGKPVFENGSGDLEQFLLAAYKGLGLQYPKFYKMDLLSKLGWISTEILLNGVAEMAAYPHEEVGVVLSNSSSSLDTDRKYFETTKTVASPAVFVYTLPNIMIGEICIRHGFKGENAFFISQEFDPVFIWQYVSNLFNIDTLQACICGWVEVAGKQWKAALYLVELRKTDNPVPFTTDNLKTLFQTPWIT